MMATIIKSYQVKNLQQILDSECKHANSPLILVHEVVNQLFAIYSCCPMS